MRNEILHREPRGHSPLSSGGCDCLSGNGPEIALFEYPNLKCLLERYTLLTFMESVFRLYSGNSNETNNMFPKNTVQFPNGIEDVDFVRFRLRM